MQTMAQTSTESLDLTIEDAAASWQRHLRAANKVLREAAALANLGRLRATTGWFLTAAGSP